MILIDTHVLLWLLFSPESLSEKAKSTLEDNQCCVSTASFWEMAVKISIQKLTLPKSLAEVAAACKDMGIIIDDITLDDCLAVQNLPFIHRDPFDRVIIAHALTNNLPLLTHDGNIQEYSMIETIW